MTVKILDAFESKYLKALDLKGRPRVVTMRQCIDRGAVVTEDGHDLHRPLLMFDEYDKGLVMNPTKAGPIIDLYGDETDDWVGRQIVIFPTECDLDGETVACIRCRAPVAKPKKPAAKKPVKR